ATPGASPRPAPLRVDSDRFQARFDVALRFWRYAMLTIGGDDKSVIGLDDPELAPLRAAIARNLDQPDRGYELFVKDPTPELWVQPAGAGAQLLSRGQVVKLRGPGNRIGFWGYVVQLPEPAAPIPRFGPRHVPTPYEIADVLGVREHELSDLDAVKSAYRELVRRFHPDRHDGDPGHLSRFLEIQTCFDAWKRTVAASG
ncbi:MAG: DnaJ domain-containing protein, partial [Myxococcota bacterium]